MSKVISQLSTKYDHNITIQPNKSIWNYTTSIFGRMVKFGHLVFYLFGHWVEYSAVRFSIYSAVWIGPYGQVRLK